MKEVKQKPKMKGAKVLDTASRAPRDMKDTMMKMREQAPDRAEAQESTTEYGENVMRDGMDRVTNSTVHAVDSSIHKATERTKESYTDHSTYKGGKDYAEKQAQSAYTADTHKPSGHYSQAPKTQPKNTVSSVKQGVEKSAKTTQRTVKTGTKTVKATSKTVKTAKNTEKTAKAAKKSASTAKEAAKKTAQGIKALGKAIVRGIKAVIRGIAGLIAAIAAGGWVAVIIILFIGVIAFILMLIAF